MSWILALPLLIPFATATLAFLLKTRAAGRIVSVLGAAAMLAAAIVLMVATLDQDIVVGQMGDWGAPFGITLVADLLSATMVVITAVIALAVAIFACGELDERIETLGWHALFHILIGGVTGAFLTGDLFNLYVWFEVMLISSFGLLVMGGSKAQIDGGVKYVALNLVSTILFLTAIGTLYAMTGTLNLADLSRSIASLENQGMVTVVAMLFMVAFGIKAAVFPLFFWLPAAYHTPSFATSAVFAGLLTKVGVYALIRMFSLVFIHDIAWTHTILLWVACATMVVGVLGAAAQNDFRKILSFHIVSQIGYMILGLAIFTPLAMLGAVFYLVHHIIVKANLFLVAGVADRLTGSTSLTRIGGLYAHAPLLAFLFFIPAFSLAGFPPLSGFWAKLFVVRAAVEDGLGWAVFFSLAVGALTIFSMTKIWDGAFWEPHPEKIEPRLSTLPRGTRLAMIWPIAGLAALTCVIGFMPEPFVQLAERSAAQLLDPDAYIAAVLGEDAG